MLNKFYLSPIFSRVLQVQLVLLEKMEVLVHLGQLGLLVLEGLWERLDLR